VTSVLLAERPYGVLALGAHPDDVEIGCGGNAFAACGPISRALGDRCVVHTLGRAARGVAGKKLGRQLCRSAAGPAWVHTDGGNPGA
jgi:LmbE family N-acetylglucosaminyl deacetylase